MSSSVIASNTDATQPLTIPQVIEKLTVLQNRLFQAVVGVSADAEQSRVHVFPNGNGGDDEKENAPKKGEKETSSGKEVFRYEMDKVCREMRYMVGSFEKLKKFEENLSELLKNQKSYLKALERNVEEFVEGVASVSKSNQTLPKQVRNNLRLLRANVLKMRLQVSLQQHRKTYYAEDLQIIFHSGETDDLPELEMEKVFEESSFFEEIQEKFDQLEKRLQLCLLCFSVLPRNAEVRKRLLKYWWVGEDLIPNNVKAENFVDETLRKFMEMGFVEPVLQKSRLKAKSFRMLSFVHPAAVMLAKEKGFYDFYPSIKPALNFASRYRGGMVKNEEESSSSRRLVADTLITNLERLEALFNISEQFPEFKLELFSRMKNLNVLYLGRWEGTNDRHIEVDTTDFFKGLSKMKKLRFLSLQGLFGIKELPGSVCNLSNLRILDLRACHNLELLPDRLGLLKKLTEFDVSECYLLDRMPKQLSMLSELRVLKGFVISDYKDSCTLHELAALKKLEKLSINIEGESISMESLEEGLSRFEKLQKLKIAWGGRSIMGKGINISDKGGKTRKSMAANLGKREESKKMEQGAKQRSNIKSRDKKDLGNTVTESTATKQEKKDKKQNQVTGSENAKNRNKQGNNRKRSHITKKHEDGGSDAKSVSETLDRGQRNENKKSGAAKLAHFVQKLIAINRVMKLQSREGLGRLLKLELESFPHTTLPEWLLPEKLDRLKKLYIRGGRLSSLGQLEEGNKKWTVETLRLKYLIDLKVNWKELAALFPNMKYLETVKCPRVTFCPCNGNGVWMKS